MSPPPPEPVHSVPLTIQVNESSIAGLLAVARLVQTTPALAADARLSLGAAFVAGLGRHLQERIGVGQVVLKVLPGEKGKQGKA